MPIVWLVTVADQDRNFRRRQDALTWLRALTHDERPRVRLLKQDRYRYWYFGPGEDLRDVTRAAIDRLGFPPARFYAVRKRRRGSRTNERTNERTQERCAAERRVTA